MLLRPVSCEPGHEMTRDTALLFATRATRLFAYGFLSVVLVLYLSSIRISEHRIGTLLSLTLIGDVAISLYLTSSIVRGIEVRSFGSLLLAAAMIGIINAFVRPIVLLLTLPLSIVTLGFFVLVVNALMFMLASAFVPGFVVYGFWGGFFGWLVMSFFTFCINALIGEHGRLEVITVRY